MAALDQVPPMFALHQLRVPPSADEIRRMLRPYVTEWGSDPVWASHLPDPPATVNCFPRKVSHGFGLTLEEVASEAIVDVAGHEVYFDRDRKLWYCDIEIDVGNSYFPFVRLALARYQPHSVSGAELSRIVMADFVQLAPHRHAELVLGPDGAQITVRGYTGRNFRSNLPHAYAVIESVDPNTLMRVGLQHRTDAVPTDLGWQPVGAEVTLDAAAEGYDVTWSGTIPLPPKQAGDCRLMITEVEIFPRDPTPDEMARETTPRSYGMERIVYADSFDL
jgi:hypothetical protein